jgi:aspartyl-tRNA(Asn)/glutamyl-tRNA(Gln) amidotransferase subunit A
MRTVVGIADDVRRGRLRAVDVLGECLAAIASQNAKVNAFVFTDAEGARRAARAIDARVAEGIDPGPLAGVPFGVKDLEPCAGMPCSQGSLLVKGEAPALTDSIHVGRLRAAGAIPVGMTAAAEFGMDSATWTKAWGVTRNPWNLERTPGGSSGGSAAAVAAGLVPLATAGDSGGSTRSPAANTGLVGLKPSMGRIPRDGSGSTYSCPGALTCTVADAARYLDVVAGPDNRDRMTLPSPGVVYERAIDVLEVAGLRAAWSADLGYIPVEAEVVDIARTAAERLVEAARLRRVDRPVRLTNIYLPFLRLAFDYLRTTMKRDGVLPSRIDDLSVRLREGLERLKPLSKEEEIEARGATQVVEQEVAELFADIDVLLTPVTPCRPFRADGPFPPDVAGRSLEEVGVENFPLWANATWNPSISVPAGLTSDGLPVGLLISGRRHRDDEVLRLARVLEQAHPWPHHPPGW